MNNRELAELCILHSGMQKQKELEMLLNFLEGRPCETVLEIGSGHGGTLWLWQHLPGNKTAIAVDLPGGAFGGGLTEDDVASIENWMDLKQNTHIARMDSHLSATLDEVKETLGDRQVDILFLDGDHSYEGVKKDFEMYSPLVKPGGVIIFHDVAIHAPETGCEVHKFWAEIKTENPDKTHEFIEPSEPSWAGLAVLEV